jgi:hypothetical protein
VAKKSPSLWAAAYCIFAHMYRMLCPKSPKSMCEKSLPPMARGQTMMACGERVSAPETPPTSSLVGKARAWARGWRRHGAANRSRR